MTSRLMQQELECVERILKQHRIDMQKPIEPDSAAKYADRAAARYIQALERQRDSAWLKSSKMRLTDRINKEKHKLEKQRREANNSSEKQKAEMETEVQQWERLFAEIKSVLSIPGSFFEAEEQIRLTNDEIVAAAREYLRVAQPFTNSMQKAGLPDLLHMSGEIASQDEEFKGKNPLTEDNIAKMTKAAEGFVGMIRAAVGAALAPEWTKMSQTAQSFAGLKLYKLTVHSDELQDKRDDLVAEYLKEATEWNDLKLRSEIRKRTSELETLPNIAIPNVNLFTTTNFPLKNPFVRQRQFLDELLEIWTPRKMETAVTQNDMERNRVEGRIKKLRDERASVLANPDYDSHEQQIRINMYDDAIEAELEKLKSFIA